MALVVLPIYSTTATVVLGPADKPPTGHLACQIMQRYRLRALFCPPTIFEQLVQEPEGLEQAKRLDFLLYAGGPLSTSTGDLLSQVTDVCQFYGSTETGTIQALVPQREHWASLEWHPSVGVDMQPSEDDAFELVLRRNPKLQGIRSLACNFPDVDVWHTRDLFRPESDKPNMWRFHGRRDDIIVLSNGAKFNPVPSEAIIAGHHLLSAALIVGFGRFQAALLIEPKIESGIEKDSLIKAVWPTIETANAQAPGHARIIRSMIAVANSNKRFERASKGTVVRKATTEKFVPEIEALYSKNDMEVSGPRLGAKDSLEAIHKYVRACIDFSFLVPNLEDVDDLYVLGLDSLKSLEIVGLLKSGMNTSDISWLSAQTLYMNPTIHSLSSTIHKRLSQDEKSLDEDDSSEQLRAMNMASFVHKYTQDLPQTHEKKSWSPSTSGLNVVLTGSTGSLGTHLLLALLDDVKTSKIYCLNRSVDAREKQTERFRQLGVRHNLDPSRVDFITADFSQSKLGLTELQFEELTSSVDIIIHNAWKVDFNHSLESFEPVHLRGVRNLVDWSNSSSRRPHIIYISSISSAGNRQNYPAGAEVAETPTSKHQNAQKMGYAESKNVAECILDIANKKSGVPVSILRIGQIAGPVKVPGTWNKDEWFPSLIKSSQSLGCVPTYLPDANWIPVDITADIVLDIVHFATNTGHTRTFNIVNPKSTAWTAIIDTVLQRLGPQVKVVDINVWIDMLAQVNQTDVREVTAKPAVKILDFYRECERERLTGGLSFSTANGVAASATMANLEPVNSKWMETWLGQWGYYEAVLQCYLQRLLMGAQTIALARLSSEEINQTCHLSCSTWSLKNAIEPERRQPYNS